MDDMTLGKRIAALRRQHNWTQEELAEAIGVTPQAVSKWENEQTCPDISLLPALARKLDVTVDELLSGKQENVPAVQQLPETQRRDPATMILRIVVDSADGDHVRVNLPLTLVQAFLDFGADAPEISVGGDALKNINWAQILELAQRGIVGDLVEVESGDGDIVHIFVE